MGDVGGCIITQNCLDFRHHGRGQQLPSAVMVLARREVKATYVGVVEYHLRPAERIGLWQDHDLALDQSGLRRRLQLRQHVVQDQHAGGFVCVQGGVHVGLGGSPFGSTKAKHA